MGWIYTAPEGPVLRCLQIYHKLLGSVSKRTRLASTISTVFQQGLSTSQGCPKTHYLASTGLTINLPSVFQMLGLRICVPHPVCFTDFNFVNYIYLYMCVYVYLHVPQSTCYSQRTACRSWLFLPTVWSRVIRLGKKHLNALHHGTGFALLIFSELWLAMLRD